MKKYKIIIDLLCKESNTRIKKDQVFVLFKIINDDIVFEIENECNKIVFQFEYFFKLVDRGIIVEIFELTDEQKKIERPSSNFMQ